MKKNPKIYTKTEWPFDEDDSPKMKTLYKSLTNTNKHVSGKIGLFVGMNMRSILKLLALVGTTRHDPYATRQLFGWAFTGPSKMSTKAR